MSRTRRPARSISRKGASKSPSRRRRTDRRVCARATRSQGRMGRPCESRQASATAAHRAGAPPGAAAILRHGPTRPVGPPRPPDPRGCSAGRVAAKRIAETLAAPRTDRGAAAAGSPLMRGTRTRWSSALGPRERIALRGAWAICGIADLVAVHAAQRLISSGRWSPRTVGAACRDHEIDDGAAKFDDRAAKFDDRAAKFDDGAAKFDDGAAKFDDRAAKSTTEL